MTTRAPLDSFESALLSELRDTVAERSATRSQPRRRRPILVAAAAATAVAASVGAVVFGLGTGGTAPASAYSVKTQGDGDVVVTIHRLEDAEGLEQALREHGLDVDVNYDPDLFEEEVPQSELDQVRPVKPNDFPPSSPEDLCGGFLGKPAIIAEKVGSDYRFTIPADSTLQDRPFNITTNQSESDGVALSAGFQASDDIECFLAQTN